MTTATAAGPRVSAEAYGPHPPTLADVEAATAITDATVNDPSATMADRERAAELEEATLTAYLREPGAIASLGYPEPEPEMELEL
jgi:hypothetical protein